MSRTVLLAFGLSVVPVNLLIIAVTEPGTHLGHLLQWMMIALGVVALVAATIKRSTRSATPEWTPGEHQAPVCERRGHLVTARDCFPDGFTVFHWEPDAALCYMERSCPHCARMVRFPLSEAPYYPPNLPPLRAPK